MSTIIDLTDIKGGENYYDPKRHLVHVEALPNGNQMVVVEKKTNYTAMKAFLWKQVDPDRYSSHAVKKSLSVESLTGSKEQEQIMFANEILQTKNINPQVQEEIDLGKMGDILLDLPTLILLIEPENHSLLEKLIENGKIFLDSKLVPDGVGDEQLKKVQEAEKKFQGTLGAHLLHRAISKRNVEAIKILIRSGVDITEVVEPEEGSALQRCMESGDLELLNLLLNSSESGRLAGRLVHQGEFISKLYDYCESRVSEGETDRSIHEGICYGLVQLDSYYFLTDREEDLERRIEKLLDYQPKEKQELEGAKIGNLERIAQKRVEVSKSEGEGVAKEREENSLLKGSDLEMELFANDVLYLHARTVPGMAQKNPVESLKDHFEVGIEDLHSSLDFPQSFMFDDETRSYRGLEDLLVNILSQDDGRARYIQLSTGNHALGIGFKNGKISYYDPDFPVKVPLLDFSLKDPHRAVRIVVEFLKPSLLRLGLLEEGAKAPFSLNFNVISKEKLAETEKLHSEQIVRLAQSSPFSLEGRVKVPLLSLAALEGNLEAVEALIEGGADLNLGFFTVGETPLFSAVKKGYLEVVEKLIEAGVDLDKGLPTGETPLFSAAKKGYLEIVEKLIEAGADVNVKNQSGRNALFYAVTEGGLEVVEKFIEKKADLNQVIDENNTSVLMLASDFCYPKIVDALVRAGAEVGAVDKEGDTALHFAVRRGDLEIIEKLVKGQKQVDKVNVYGQTPLIIALEKANLEATNLLIKHGADLSDYFDLSPYLSTDNQLTEETFPKVMQKMFEYLQNQESQQNLRQQQSVDDRDMDDPFSEL